MNMFLGKPFIYSMLTRLLKSPVKRGSINWLDRLPVIEEMAALKLTNK